MYRLLVSHASVLEWRRHSVAAIGKLQHLYTCIINAQETDGVERWLNREVESPAAPAIGKVITDARLSSEDWASLIRFLTAQDVRTPARLMDILEYGRRPETQQSTQE